MKKQILYPKFIPRLFAITIDLAILSIVLTPIMNIVARYIFITTFKTFFLEYNIDMSDSAALAKATSMPEFASYITATKFFGYTSALFIINTIFMGGYFVFFWSKFGATPGKMLMRMKIVDANDSKSLPSTYRCIKRFCGYITAFMSLLYVHFNKRGMALHDKMANTVVIKS